MLVTQIKGGSQGQTEPRNWGRDEEKVLNYNMYLCMGEGENHTNDQGIEMRHKDPSLFGAGRRRLLQPQSPSERSPHLPTPPLPWNLSES